MYLYMYIDKGWCLGRIIENHFIDLRVEKNHQCLFWREIDNLRCAALDLDPQAKTGLGRVKRMKFQSTFPSQDSPRFLFEMVNHFEY